MAIVPFVDVSVIEYCLIAKFAVMFLFPFMVTVTWLTSSAASLAGTTVTVCRNAECYTATLPDVPVAGGGGTGLFFSGTTFVLGTLWQNASGSIGLDLEWHLDSSQLQDGDHYVVTFTNAAGVVTPVLDKTATYTQLPPSPEECAGGATCSIANLTN